QKRAAIMAYGALIVATLAQLAVPHLVQSMITTVTDGFAANSIMAQNFVVREIAASQMGTTVEALENIQQNSVSWLFNAVLIVVLFSIIRAMFSFVQAYMAENTSQGVAYDFRNEIYAKLQRLSFSYYDKNQTGQLMIRATDDVEKVRLFIAQGLILTAQ